MMNVRVCVWGYRPAMGNDVFCMGWVCVLLSGAIVITERELDCRLGGGVGAEMISEGIYKKSKLLPVVHAPIGSDINLCFLNSIYFHFFQKRRACRRLTRACS